MADRNGGSRVLRFVVSGALLALPLVGCGDDDDDRVYVNEPAPQPVPVNEIAPEQPNREPPPGPVVPAENAPAEHE